MFSNFLILGLFSFGCSGVSVTPGDYDVSTSLVTDECGFFDSAEFESETWTLTVSEDNILTTTIEEDSFDYVQGDDTYTYEDVVETDLGDGAILVAAVKAELIFDGESFTGTSTAGYSCDDGGDCDIDELPCNAAFKYAGVLIVD